MFYFHSLYYELLKDKQPHFTPFVSLQCPASCLAHVIGVQLISAERNINNLKCLLYLDHLVLLS